jgi:hypothetical protein
MQRNTAASFALTGIALLAMGWSKPRLALIISATTGALATATLFEYLLHANFGIDEILGRGYITTQTSDAGRMSPTTAICFLLIAIGFGAAHTGSRSRRSAWLGVTGLLLHAVGAACFIALISGTSDAFASGNLTRVALPTAIGFLLLGIGMTAVGWDLTRPGLGEPARVPIGATLLVAIVRVGLWQAFTANEQIKVGFLTLLGGILSASLFGVVIHLALFRERALRRH